MEKLKQEIAVSAYTTIERYGFSMEKLKQVAKNLTDILDGQSKLIIDFEQTMNKFACKFPYSMIIRDENNEISYLSWEKHIEAKKKNKNYRIYLKTTDNKGNEIKKDLIECSLDIRLYYIPYIIQFIDEYTNYIEKLMLKIKDSSVNEINQ